MFRNLSFIIALTSLGACTTLQPGYENFVLDEVDESEFIEAVYLAENTQVEPLIMERIEPIAMAGQLKPVTDRAMRKPRALNQTSQSIRRMHLPQSNPMNPTSSMLFRFTRSHWALFIRSMPRQIRSPTLHCSRAKNSCLYQQAIPSIGLLATRYPAQARANKFIS